MKQKTAHKTLHETTPTVIAADSFVCQFLTSQLVSVLTETWAGTPEHETAWLLHHELRNNEYVPLSVLQIVHAFLDEYTQSGVSAYT